MKKRCVINPSHRMKRHAVRTETELEAGVPIERSKLVKQHNNTCDDTNNYIHASTDMTYIIYMTEISFTNNELVLVSIVK